MDRSFLENLGLEKEGIDKVLNQHGSELENLKSQLQESKDMLLQKSNELEKVNEKINILNNQQSTTEQDTQKINELKKQHETEIEKYKSELQNIKFKTALDNKLKDIEFSSKSAQNAFLNAASENIRLENDELDGFDDFINKYKEDDPAAFKSNDKPILSTAGKGAERKTEEEAYLAEKYKNNKFFKGN